jgi:cysteine desulfurase/selenocysteine lyase
MSSEGRVNVDDCRELFPVTGEYNFQDHAAVAPLSKPAADAMRACIDNYLTFAGRTGQWYKHMENVRRVAARFVNAQPEEIAFVKNTSEGLCFVANGLNWNTGDNVVTTGVEFPANIYPWMNLRARGVSVRMVPEEDGRVPLERVMELVDGRTRLVTISAVQYASGYRTDLVALGNFCKEKGIFLCVDAIQALGVLPVDVQKMNIDFLSADGHKWLLGPEGAGIFFCRSELLAHLRPSTVGWLCMKNAEDFGHYQFEFRDDARRFDSGAYNVAGICGLGASLELLDSIGMDKISEKVLRLTDQLAVGVREKGYRVISSRRPREKSGIVSFFSDRHDPTAIREHLRSEYRIVIAVRDRRLRASPHFYNTPDEIQQLIDVLPAH